SDLALSERSRLCARARAAGARSRRDREGGRREPDDRGHFAAAPGNPGGFRAGRGPGRVAGGAPLPDELAESPAVVAAGPGGGPAARDPGDARLRGPAGTGVAAARALARRALSPRRGNRSNAVVGTGPHLRSARSGAVMTAPHWILLQVALWKPVEPRRSPRIRSSSHCGSGTLPS